MTNTVYRGYRATDKPRCRACQGFLPESAGQNRIVCPNCNTPQMYVVGE